MYDKEIIIKKMSHHNIWKATGCVCFTKLVSGWLCHNLRSKVKDGTKQQQYSPDVSWRSLKVTKVRMSLFFRGPLINEGKKDQKKATMSEVRNKMATI